MKKLICMLTFLFLTDGLAYSWDGYDYENNSYIEIQEGNFVRHSNDIDVFDYDLGEYKTYEVENVSNNEIEVYDYETGEYRTFEMD